LSTPRRFSSLPASNPFAALENGTFPKKVRRKNFDGRLDHRLSDSHNMYLRYAFDFYGDFAPEKPNRRARRRPDHDWQRRPERFQQVTQPCRRRELDSSRVRKSIRCVRTCWFTGYMPTPTFTGQGITRPSFSWGQQQQSPQKFPRNRVTITDALLVTKGKHDLNVGGEWTWGTTGSTRTTTEGGLWTFRSIRRSIVPIPRPTHSSSRFATTATTSTAQRSLPGTSPTPIA